MKILIFSCKFDIFLQGLNVMVQFCEHFGWIEPDLGLMLTSGGYSIMKLILWLDVLVITMVSIISAEPYLQLVSFMDWGVIEQLF